MIKLKDLLGESIIDSKQAEKIAKELEKKIDAPFVQPTVSELGGGDRPSVMLRVSLQPKSDWPNNIFMNSLYSQFQITHDGVIEQFAKSYKIKKKFRKSRFNDASDVVKKINKYLKDIANEQETI